MKVKYVRWSTLQQSGQRQLIDTSGYDLVLQEQISGAVAFADRPKGSEILRLIRAGKIAELHVEELTRLGRNAYDTINTLRVCEESRVNVAILNMSLHSRVNGKPNGMFKIVTYLLSALAEQERENIRERTEMGKIAARNKGVVFGRPAGANENTKTFLGKPNNVKVARLIKENRLSIREIAGVTNTSPSTVQKVKRLLA